MVERSKVKIIWEDASTATKIIHAAEAAKRRDAGLFLMRRWKRGEELVGVRFLASLTWVDSSSKEH